MASQEFLTKAYLAYFGRPVDVTGQAYWATKTEAEVIAGFSASNESRALYGDEFNVNQINAIYNNLFNRDAEPDGLNYWLTQVFSGVVAPLEAALAILNGAANEDKTAVENKLAASRMFTEGLDTTPEILGYNGAEAAEAARSFLSTVTTTVPTQDQVDQAVATVTGVGGVPGGTFTLTQHEDSGAAFVGTAGNDTFNAPVVEVGGALVNTLNSVDVLDGGAGTDTLNATLNGGTVAANISNIEILNLRAAAGSTVDFANVTGAEQIWNTQSTAALSYQNAPIAATFGVRNTTAQTNLTSFDDVSGTDDVLNLVVNGAGTSGTAAVVASAVAGSIEGLNVSASGTNNVQLNAFTAAESLTLATSGALTLSVGSDAMTDITVNGTGDLSLSGTTSFAVVENVAAAGFGGNLSLDVSASATLESVVTGAGNDVITINGTLLNTGAERDIDLGGGDNTLRLTGINNNATLGALVFTGDDLSVAGVSTLSLVSGLTLAGADAALDLDGLGSADVVFEGAVALGGRTLTLENTAAALDLTFGGALDSGAANGVLDLGDAAETVTITAEGMVGATHAITLVGEVLSALTLNVEDNADIDFGATEEALENVVINVSNGAEIVSTISGNAGDEFSLVSLTLTDGSEDGDGSFDIKLTDTVNLTSINLSGGEATLFTIDASKAQFAGAVTINIGDFGVDADGVPAAAGGLDYTADTTGTLREVFKFVGENIGNIGIDDFMAGVGGNADRLDFSAFDGVSGLDDLNLSLSGGNTVITSDAFDGTITVLGVDLTTDAFNFIF